ncbi:MAG: hypothetical protein NVS9B3_12380 [Gemmatimonadaceae bacterium]
MKRRQVKTLDAFRRVHVLLTNHPPAPMPRGLATQVGILGRLIDRLDALAAAQRALPIDAKRRTRSRAALHRHLRERQIQPVAQIARAFAPQ